MASNPPTRSPLSAMPSFLNDHDVPIYTQSSGVLHLNDHHPQYKGMTDIGLAVDGQNPRIINSHHTPNDSFDGSSSHSTNTSDTSDAPPNTSGNDTRTSTMSTSILQNGANDDGEGEHTVNGFNPYDAPQKPQYLPNGTAPATNTTTLPDRTVSPRPNLPNGTAERTSSNMSYAEPPSIRTSIASVTSPQPSPMGMAGNQVYKGDPNTSSAQRFSSPAQMSGNPNFSASTSNLHPASAGLKHRHTLEVPRPGPGQPRGSKDGMDSAMSSGRFSPTGSGPSGARRASINLVRRNTRSMHSDFPRDEAYPDEDAMRWAEAYRQKRASKRRRKEEEDDDRVLIGNKVDEKHANWVTAYNMLTGIRVSVSRTNAKLDRPLTDADFEAKAKTTFDM